MISLIYILIFTEMAVKIIFNDDSYRLRTLGDIDKVWRIFDIESQKTDTIIFFHDSTLWNKFIYSYKTKILTEKYAPVTCQGYDEFIFALEKEKKNVVVDYEKTVWTFNIEDCSKCCYCDNY